MKVLVDIDGAQVAMDVCSMCGAGPLDEGQDICDQHGDAGYDDTYVPLPKTTPRMDVTE